MKEGKKRREMKINEKERKKMKETKK